jgi:hypothetical protein
MWSSGCPLPFLNQGLLKDNQCLKYGGYEFMAYNCGYSDRADLFSPYKVNYV